jgi:membrane protein
VARRAARARPLRLSKADLEQLAKGVADEFSRHDLLTYSSAIAFQILYAVVPLALVALAGLSLVGERTIYTHHIAPTLQAHLSSDAFGIANRTAMKVMAGRTLFWVTVGLAITLWGVGAALRSMMTPLNAIYGARETRSWTRRMAVSLFGGLIVIVFVFTAAIAVLGGRLVHPHGVVGAAFFLLRWVVALVLLLATIAVLIRLVPAKKRPVRWITIGSLLSAVSWIVATIGFGAYISTISYSSYYGGLGSVILLLIYLHVSAIAFLLGVSVDSQLRQQVRDTRRQGRTRKRPGT